MSSSLDTTTTTKSLSDWLRTSKKDFLHSLNNGDSLHSWVIVNGNEAGDLDSLASSIAFAYFASSNSSSSSSSSSASSSATTQTRRYIPLLLTSHEDIALRPENVHALESAGSDLKPFTDTILSVQELQGEGDSDTTTSELGSRGVKFALVDHNVLLPMFRPKVAGGSGDGGGGEEGKRAGDDYVSAIIDHHADERQHESASPRLIQVLGSCASLVTHYFKSAASPSSSSSSSSSSSLEFVPQPLANLLLSAILIDTGLKSTDKGGKATLIDIDSVETLLPFSSFASASSNLAQDIANAGSTATATATATEDGGNRDALMAYHAILQQKKGDVGNLNGRDLLRRDYKEYATTSVSIALDVKDSESGQQQQQHQQQHQQQQQQMKYGLATVPLSLGTWLDRDGADKFKQDVVDWAIERQLGFVGVLTSYAVKDSNPSVRGREVLIYIARAGGEDKEDEEEQEQEQEQEARLRDMCARLERDQVLQFRQWQDETWSDVFDDNVVNRQGGETGTGSATGTEHGTGNGNGQARWRVWQQTNVKATRKQVAPAIRSILES